MTYAGQVGALNPTATEAEVSAAVAALVNGAPAQLNTLEELADALGDDANFASTVSALLAGKLAKASNLSDVADVPTARASLGLGSAALSAASAFDAAGAAAAAQAASQPVDADLTAIAALTTTAYGRAFLALADAAAARTALALGSAALSSSTDFDASGAAAAVQALAALRANNLSDLANAGTARGNLGLGSAATQASSAFETAGTAVLKSVVTAADDLIVASGSGAVTNLAVAASRIIGKKTSGGIAALTAAEVNAITGAITSLVSLRGAAVGTTMLSTGVTGDAADRFTIGADGKLSWGTGAGAVDTNVYRSAANQLCTDDALWVNNTGRTFIDGQIENSSGGSVKLAQGAVTRLDLSSVGIQLQTNTATEVNLRVGGLAGGASTVDIIQIASGGINGTRCWGLRNGLQAGMTNVGGAVYFGTGAPVDANGANGDIAFRVDGGVLTTVYQRRAGAWVGIV